MSLIDRYIILQLLKAWLLVFVIVSAVVGILTFVDELEHVEDQYSVFNALQFIALTLPQRSLDLAPVITLLGTLIALATLSKHSELIAIRAAGISTIHLLRAIALPTCLLIVTLELAAEYLSAPLYQKAEFERGTIISGNGNLLKGKGLWFNKGRRFINIRELHPDRRMFGVDLYEFDRDRKLILAINADHATIIANDTWRLFDVNHKELIDDRLLDNHWENLDISAWLSQDELSLLSASNTSMPLSILYQYTQYLQATGQQADRLELLFWQKVTTPFAAGAMVFLAVPLGTWSGSQRNGSFGLRITVGAITGIIFYLGTQIIYAIGLLLRLNAVVITLIPILIILVTSVFLLLCIRSR